MSERLRHRARNYCSSERATARSTERATERASVFSDNNFQSRLAAGASSDRYRSRGVYFTQNCSTRTYLVIVTRVLITPEYKLEGVRIARACWVLPERCLENARTVGLTKQDQAENTELRVRLLSSLPRSTWHLFLRYIAPPSQRRTNLRPYEFAGDTRTRSSLIVAAYR